MKFCLILILAVCSALVSAQETLSPEAIAELTRMARSPELSLSDKGKISEAVAKYIQDELSQTSTLKNKTPKEFKDFFINNPNALDKLGIKNNDPIRDVISEFSQLINSIQVTEKLKECKTSKKDVLQSIANKTGDDFSICDQGKTVQEFVIWGPDKAKNSYPGFFYFDQGRDLAAIKNIADIASLKISDKPSIQLGGSLEKIRAQNPKKDAVQVAKLLELRESSYIRAISNSFKTVGMLRVLYQNPPLPLDKLDDLRDEVKSYCEDCTEKQLDFILREVKSSVVRDIQFNQKKHLSELEITKSICGKLSSRGYRPEWKNEFDPMASDMEVKTSFDPKKGFVSDTIPKAPVKGDFKKFTPPKLDSAKVDRSFEQKRNEQTAIMGTIGEGWEGLLLMTPDLTSKNSHNEPERVFLDCLNVNNPKNKELVGNAVATARFAPLKYLQDLNQTMDFKKLKEDEVIGQLKTMMKENKRSIGEALLLQPDLSPLVCNLANRMAKEEAIADAQSMALTWGAMIVGGALELTGVLAPAGAWLQGTVITARTAIIAAEVLEVAGGVYAVAESYAEASNLDDEAGRELIAALALGGDKELLESSFSKSKSAENKKSMGELLSAFTVLNVGRLAKMYGKFHKLNKVADNLISPGPKNLVSIGEIKQLNQSVYKAIPDSKEAGTLASFEAKVGKNEAQKLNRYADALDARDRMRLLNALEKDLEGTVAKLSKLPCYNKAISTKCLTNLQGMLRNNFNNVSINFHPLTQKIGKVDDDFAETLKNSNLSQLEVNHLAKTLPKEKLTKEATEDLKEYMEFISNQPLKKRMAAIQDVNLVISPGKKPTPLIEKFRTLQSQAAKKEDKWFSKELKILKKESKLADDQMETVARERAKLKRADWQKRSAACSSKIPNSYNTAGIGKFVSFTKKVGPSYSGATYILSNLGKEKDAEWFKTLGWEMITSVVYSRVPGLILKNRMDSKGVKIIKETLVGMTLNYTDAKLYTLLIKDKSKSSDFEKVMADPKTKQALIEMAKKVSEITETKGFMDAVGEQDIAKNSVATNENIDNDDSQENLEEIFSDEELRKIYQQTLAGEKQSNPLVTTGNPANDLFAFNYAWGLGVGTPKRVFVQEALKKMMCMGDTKSSLALYTMDRLLSGKLYYEAREEIFGL